MKRWKCIGNVWVTIVIALFAIEAVVFTVQANRGVYTECPVLIEQYNNMAAEGENTFTEGTCAVAACQNACNEAVCQKGCTKACGDCAEANCAQGQCENANCGNAQCASAAAVEVVEIETETVND